MFFKQLLAGLLVLFSVSSVLQVDEPFERKFRMGFTGFPHDFSLAAITETREFCRENGDIIAHHIEGVAWTECLNDQPFPKKRLDDWKGKKTAVAKNGKVYLAISPGRGTLQLLEDCQPIADALKGKPYDDPLVKKTYLTFCQRMLKTFDPDYLCIGIEVNDIYRDAGPDVWRAYVSLHKHVYESLKRERKDLPIFASATLHNILNTTGTQRRKIVDAFAQVLPYCDTVAISYYPFIQGGTTDTAAAFKWLSNTFDKYQKPYAIVETGEAAQRLTFPSSGQRIQGTPDRQCDYVNELLNFAQTHETDFVIWFIHRDYDAMWEKIKAHTPEAHMAWRDCGLLDEKGKPRSAMLVWQKFFTSQ